MTLIYAIVGIASMIVVSASYIAVWSLVFLPDPPSWRFK